VCPLNQAAYLNARGRNCPDKVVAGHYRMFIHRNPAVGFRLPVEGILSERGGLRCEARIFGDCGG
jgi:hypothetical protein